MSGKILIAVLAASVILAGGCTRVHEEAKPQDRVSVAPPGTVPPKPVPARTLAKPSTPPRPPEAPREAAPPPRADLPPLIHAASAWTDYGKSLVVTRGRHQPVPLFRQAIVLASVRAAVAGSPAAPRVEFRRGRLTLTFGRGTNAEIAAAINRAIDVPEVTRLEILLQG
ncbi:MAG: hypothetical protein IAE97_02690 [Chthoniobacterales bacterium]|nr:hypothetical protein [Chthoniobacterales bacterium]